MIAGRLLWLLAASAAILPVAPGLAKKTPPAPLQPVVSDEELYRDAMECKVRVEALGPLARKADRKRVAHALAFWTEQEKILGAKLGKSFGDMVKDEIFFGLQEGSSTGALRRADMCVRLAVAANLYR